MASRFRAFPAALLAFACTLHAAGPVCREDPWILCRVADLNERLQAKALVQAWKVERDVEKTKRLAADFVGRYPRSAFLHWAWDHWAWALFASEEEAGAAMAMKSLAIAPENPALQLQLAQYFEQTHQWAEASDHALQALLYAEGLYRRRGAFRIDDGDEVRLVSGAGGILLRISQLAHAPWEMQQRRRALARLLLTSGRLLAAHPSRFEREFLLAVGSAQADAARSFLSLARQYRPDREGGTVAGETPEWEVLLPALGLTADVRDAIPVYAGSASCSARGCHLTVRRSWRASGMGAMSRDISRGAAGAMPPSGNRQRVGDTWVEFRTGGRRPPRVILDHDDEQREFPVTLTIGSLWEQSFATLLNGRLMILPLQYSRRVKSWEVYGAEEEDVRQSRIAEFFGPRPGSEPGMAKEFFGECAPCHATRVRRDSRRPGGGDVLEYGIGCEACHGPSADHAQAGRDKLRKVFVPRKELEVDAVCLPCHTHTAVFVRGDGGELNYSGRRYPFVPRVQRRSLDEYSREAFLADGRLRRATFIGEALRRTKCFRNGATCAKCHQIHPTPGTAEGKHHVNLLRFPEDSDRFCTECHKPFAEIVQVRAHLKHTAHLVEGKPLSCVSCHMPRILDAPSGLGRSHEIDSIMRLKRAGLSMQPLVVERSCFQNGCHADDKGLQQAAPLQARE